MLITYFAKNLQVSKLFVYLPLSSNNDTMNTTITKKNSLASKVEQTLTTLNKVEQIKQFINDGGSAKGALIVGKVEEKLKKTNNPLRDAKIEKLVSYRVALNCVYQNKVNNQREREGKKADFQAKENWFTPVYDSHNGSIVCHKTKRDQMYLKFICNTAIVHKYFVDGIEATPEQIEIIKQFKPEAQTPKNQDLDNVVIVRTIGIDNIIKIKQGDILELKKIEKSLSK